ncbi:MAG: extracellular solute-binding protein [Clostridiales bacterium]|nr:extracellular solute-binding protein [Clostridiales bacterium]
MKKLIATLLSAVMITGSMAGLVACGEKKSGEDESNGAKYTYDITMWVGENTKTVTEDLIKDFNKTNPYSIWFNARVNEMTESKAAGDVLQSLDTAPEIFCFAQDTIARLVANGALATPSSVIEDQIRTTHSENAVKAATVGNTVYAYPMTEDNGYFLYYDKRCFPNPEDVDSVEKIVKYCEDNNRYFSFALNTGWYAASFFYGAGAKSEWTVNSDGKFEAYEDDFNSDKGMIAAKGMQKVLQSGRYLEFGKAADFTAGTPAAAVVSGIWDYNDAKLYLKENLGIAKLPKFTVDGKDYQLASYLGCKLMGVSPQPGNDTKASALSILANYLTSEDAQMERFNKFGWGPTVKAAQEKDDVKNDPVLNILKETATVPQGQYPTSWWTAVEAMSNEIKEAKTDASIKTALETYAGKLDKMKKAEVIE